MSNIKEQIVKLVDSDSSVIALNIKQLGAVGVMPVQLTDGVGIAINTLPVSFSGTITVDSVSLEAGTNTIGKVGLVDLSGDEINWADTVNSAIRVNVVAGGAGDGSILDGVNSAIKSTVLDYANSNPLAVRLTNTDGDYVTAGAGTQYTEGDVDATITGTAIMHEIAGNTLASVSTANPLPVSDNGGNLSIDDGGNVITVDGTVNAAQSGTWNIGTVTSITNSVAVTGTFWQATQPVSIAATVVTSDAATTSIDGKITACNTGAVVLSSGTVTTVGTVTTITNPVGIKNAAADTVTGISGTYDTIDVSLTNGSNRATVDASGYLTANINGSVVVTNAGITSIDGKITACNTGAVVISSGTITAVTSITNSVAVTGTFWQATQPVSIATVVSTNWNGTAPPIGAGLEATALRVTVATDSTGVLSVDDNGGVLTVDGTVTIGSITAGDNNIGNVDVLTLPSLPAGTNNIGDVDVVSSAHGKSIKNATGTISATTTIVVAVGGKKIKVTAISLITSSTTAVTCTFKDGAAGTAKWTIPLQALSGTISGVNLAVSRPDCLFETTAGTLLELALSAAVSVTYSISYFDDD